ncbi:MAG: hypothetical protein EOP11_13090 [Proteobacteria bacterium]|nr:MAG: hypothetical protein EOP11_13090 [Pseudomonadota bacterium]
MPLVQKNKILPTLALALMALSLTSINAAPERKFRTVACLPDGATGGISGGPIAIGQDLIGQVQDAATRESAREWYNFLTEVELKSLSQRQAVRASYGIKAPLFATAADYAVPTLTPLSITPLYAPTGNLFAAPRFGGFAGLPSNALPMVIAQSPSRPSVQSGSSAFFLPRY